MAKLDYEAALLAAQNIKDGNLRLTAAPMSRVEELRAEIDELLEAIGEVRGIKNIWISDKSRLSDFSFSVAEARSLGDLLGIHAEADALVWELAERLRSNRVIPSP